MISRVEYIQQPYSGEYIEKIYDIKSPWNSTDWTWIKFIEEDDIWCGEFRGKYRGVSCSTVLGIIVVLTSDYMYVLDIYGGEIMGILFTTRICRYNSHTIWKNFGYRRLWH